jgi:FkbH-like protein
MTRDPSETRPPIPTELLSACDGSPASYLKVARDLERLDGATERRVAWLASFTTDLLAPYLTVEGARRAIALRSFFAPFGQIEQPILDAESELYKQAPEVVVVALRIEDSTPALVDRWVALAPEEASRFVDDHVARIASALTAIRQRSRARILVWNQAPLERLAAGLADVTAASSQTRMITHLNEKIADAVAAVGDAFVFDLNRIATEVGTHALYDAKLFQLARMPWSTKGQIAIGAATARYVTAMWRPPCKCLVLDLDGTLWGGVVGEDGVAGIKLGGSYPGSAFVDFQRRVLSYRDRGVLLAVASKNNEADALEPFTRHTDMAIKLDDLSAREIHWGDKASSLRSIATKLGIGVDALAFFDDNPAEREFIRRELPEVHVIEVPRSPLEYADALDRSAVFDALTITDEDLTRAHLYREDGARQALATTASSVEEFLRALSMRITIGAVGPETLPRVVQLLAKTNQFNVTTRRHSQADIERLVADGAIALWMRVEDRFGDNGLVGVAIAKPNGARDYLVDSFLMSCRVLGRQVEHALLESLARRATSRGANRLIGEFIPTPKNAPAAAFFAAAGFEPIAGTPGRFDLPLPKAEAGTPPPFEVLEVS